MMTEHGTRGRREVLCRLTPLSKIAGKLTAMHARSLQHCLAEQLPLMTPETQSWTMANKRENCGHEMLVTKESL